MICERAIKRKEDREVLGNKSDFIFRRELPLQLSEIMLGF